MKIHKDKTLDLLLFGFEGRAREGEKEIDRARHEILILHGGKRDKIACV